MTDPLPEATLAIDMQPTQPPTPIGVTVLIDGKPIAVVTLAHFLTTAAIIHRAQLGPR